MALCGLGRAGTIHLNNILANRRINLKYIVEGDESKWQPTIDKLNLTETKFLKPEVGTKMLILRNAITVQNFFTGY